MRNISWAILVVGIAIGCGKSGTDAGNNLSSVISVGSWTIHFYSNKGIDDTADFSGYTFVFNGNGTLTATKGSATTVGTWAEVKESGKTKLVIAWTGAGIPAALTELDEDWMATSITSTLIQLTHTGSSGTSELHFHR